MEYDWHTAKATKNLKKHKVSFEEAASAFGDPLAYTFPDPEHSDREERLLTFGISIEGRLLVISHTEHARGIHIISAREATAHERKIYEEG